MEFKPHTHKYNQSYTIKSFTVLFMRDDTVLFMRDDREDNTDFTVHT